MNITEPVYTCTTCRHQYPDGLAALACHQRGFIRRPVPMREYNLDIPGLLVLATAISTGLHRN